MNFVFTAGGIPAPIELSINGVVFAAIFAAALVPWFFAAPRSARNLSASQAAPEVDAPMTMTDFGAYDAPGQRAA